MTALTILMPMAGAGSRFRQTGETRPKPLVTVHGIPMFHLAAASLTRYFPDATLICVIQAAHDREFGLARALTLAVPAIRVAVVDALTGGALETCLSAEPLVDDPHAPLVVLDCDLTFASPDYCGRLRAMADGSDLATGLLLSFESVDPRYSYAELEEGVVTRTAEKVPISNHALIGAYGFSQADRLFQIARSIVDRNLKVGSGEYYVSSAFNELISLGATVKLERASDYWSFGTPEELAASSDDPDLIRHLRDLGLPIGEACS